MPRIDDLLRQMKQQGASDLHLTSGSAPYMRIHGDMVKLNYRNVSADACQSLIFEILTDKQKQLFTENWDLDLSYPLDGVGRFRVNVFMQRNGVSAVFRLIPENIKTIDELDLPEQLASLIDASEGLILVTGPTGSGKSTTLASLIHTINEKQQAHIITIEDPIEFVHQNRRCLISQRELASHTKSFGAALRAALREDPDIILVGEMRDLETISLAITAAETGHLVFATLHTTDAPQTVDRVIDVFPPEQQQQIRMQLSVTLQSVISQTLLPRADIGGRIAAFEVMVVTPAIRSLIREGKTHQLYTDIQTGGQFGMQSLDQHLLQLLSERKISYEDAIAKTSNPRDFEARAARFRGAPAPAPAARPH